MSIIRKTQQWGTFARIWHVFDATWQDPFISAPVIGKYLLGRYKPIFHPMADCGDHVVVINSKDIALRGDDWTKRVYFHHTGYHGGATWTLAWELHKKDPTLIVSKAVYRWLPKNLNRRHTMRRLHIFENDNIPEDIHANISNQIRQLKPIPTRLDHIPEENVNSFPRIVKLPENYMTKDEYKKEIENV
ncbi:39S ribosomal protein L13, mitochondrial-like [Venturia canescens]|uniref:39S ribosomal protein L13, mitochondrial-like n=1 Tax=Venturia canescens TaxID=32260 RepID=UPI001C9D35A1|nr:39S ribosomal protein L13, mitochondrial-like [Venturia canescens]